VDFPTPGSPASKYAALCLIHCAKILLISGVETGRVTSVRVFDSSTTHFLDFLEDFVPVDDSHWTFENVQNSQQLVHFPSFTDDQCQHSLHTNIFLEMGKNFISFLLTLLAKGSSVLD
jgi:hypothetical protein